ncbi:bifunctional riboflavin kinase/FAD synthetase [Neobacillus muris]|uniref:bifunctional riboflavin kinase/FAD synthetase n=1 Tax=Neobacillus muris TaxID=2941334 RepID=UPI00203F1493|nr:bifunctional riboflavin kinase/FAD synthetase [Neobacillus muris]
MDVFKLSFPLILAKNQFPPLAMALGFFDGVHLGHQKVIAEAKKQAAENGLGCAVMTFDPHPSVVLGKNNQHVQSITPLAEKVNKIAELGVDYLFIVHFTPEFANLLPQEFVDHYIIGLNVKHVAAGFDFTYGRMGKGTMETLPFHSRDMFSYSVVPKFTEGNEKVSSTRIRKLLRDGKVDELPVLLGRYYTTAGTVVHGDKRGRAIGFPTANVEISDDCILPPTGVYAVKLLVNQQWHDGVCNLGYRPTFYNETVKPSVEVHLFDYNHEFYGEEVTIEWHRRLRQEQKFAGIDELVLQIEQDKRSALQYFKENRQAL